MLEMETEMTPHEGYRFRTTSIINEQTVDYNVTSASILPPIIDETTETSNENISLFSLRQVYKNSIILCISFTLFFTAYSTMVTIQSSLNAKGNVGVNSLVVTYVFVLISSLFLTGITTDIFGLKWTILITQIMFLFYIIANIKPEPYIMYIAAALVGLAASPLWTAQAHYMGCLARDYAHHKNKKPDVIVSLFFGIFFASFNTNGIWGNIISYLILNQQNPAQVNNCGVYFQPVEQNGTDSAPDVSNVTRYALCGVFIGLSVISVGLLIAVDQIRLAQSQHINESLKKGVEVLRSLFRRKNIEQLLLVPITMWTTFESGFLNAQFTRAFITCLMGIRYVGLVLLVNGICNAVFSYVFGGLVKCIGRSGCFIIASSLNLFCLILMYHWEPKEEQSYVLYIISAIWGIADAVWQSQVVATYTVLYGETDSSAIAKYRLWKAVGSLTIYSYANHVTIETTIIVLLSLLSFAMITYGSAELYNRWKQRTEQFKEKPLND